MRLHILATNEEEEEEEEMLFSCLKRMLLRSVASGVVSHARCPVTVVK
jgi:hypothetical protein